MRIYTTSDITKFSQICLSIECNLNRFLTITSSIKSLWLLISYMTKRILFHHHWCHHLTAASNQLLDSSNGQSPKPAHSDSGSNDLLDSLTQALLSTSKKSPDIEGKISTLVDNILTGELLQDSVKERGEKYLPPANCKYLTPTLVNEELWDLLTRKNRSVDLAFQHVQEPIINGLSSLSILADRLFKDVHSVKTVNVREILTHVMDSIALFGHANWKLNMKRKELIKPDLNPPYCVKRK